MNQIYFSNYKKMEIYNYPKGYLSIRGNIKLCHEVHKKRMMEAGLPYVDYRTFYARVKKNHRNLYRAIHTPAKTNMRRKLSWLKRFFKSLFK